MDQMTGIEAVAQIREFEKGTGKHTPVIGLTSLVGHNTVNETTHIISTYFADFKFQEETVPQLINAGMDDVIFKPILRNSFLSRLEISQYFLLSPILCLLDRHRDMAPTTG
jgi:CheY-like chemotaxis protein